jgi:DNA-binding NarL/FixJ family response regulator
MTTRVLLVDDVDDVRRMVRVALKARGGFEIVGEAPDGSEAVRCADSTQPDIVVLDLGLPDLAGRDVLTRLRAVSPRSRVVVFSGSETPDKTWVKDRVEGFVLKDADLDYLVDLLESVMARPESHATLDLPHHPASAGAARAFVARTIDRWKLHELLDDALLVTSELAANAVTHAAAPCRIRLSLNPLSLRIDVLDGGQGTPEPQAASDSQENGRGLHLVSALTSAWGLEAIPDDGKLVWAELARPLSTSN